MLNRPKKGDWFLLPSKARMLPRKIRLYDGKHIEYRFGRAKADKLKPNPEYPKNSKAKWVLSNN